VQNYEEPPRMGARTLVAVAAAVSMLALAPAAAAAQESGGVEAGAQSAAPETAPAPSASSAAKLSTATIKAVQRRLGVRADGRLGPQTRRAIKRFQRRKGLPPSGRLHPSTLRALGVEPAASPPAEESVSVSARLQRIAQCESGGDPTAVSPDGRYRGKYQFLQETWESVGGTGDPAKASEAEQDRRAAILMKRQGPSAWPTCSKQS
jgi:peptidoglycan hydrolase-like protein with peptidoglycan-binding domain